MKKTITIFGTMICAVVIVGFRSCKKDAVKLGSVEKTTSITVNFSSTDANTFYSFKDTTGIANPMSMKYPP